jgi:nitronate monooxygenase
MPLPLRFRDRLQLPAFCAPMFLVSTPDLVREACKAGIVGGLPRANARSLEQFEGWLAAIRSDLDAYAEDHPQARIGPLAVNLTSRLKPDELHASLAICGRYGVEIIVSATGDPTELTRHVHDWGGLVFHDAIDLRFAEKAIRAGVDGITAVGAGGGGHSGLLSHFAFVPKLRQMFDGVIIMAGALSSGAAIRSAELLGADLAYLGTRFIATKESGASDAYRRFLVDESSDGLMYTDKIAGVHANWMTASMRAVGLDPADLPEPVRKMRYDHLPDGVKPWVNMWSAGQGINLIDDIPTVADLVDRLKQEYVAACDLPSMADVARTAAN